MTLLTLRMHSVMTLMRCRSDYTYRNSLSASRRSNSPSLKFCFLTAALPFSCNVMANTRAWSENNYEVSPPGVLRGDKLVNIWETADCTELVYKSKEHTPSFPLQEGPVVSLFDLLSVGNSPVRHLCHLQIDKIINAVSLNTHDRVRPTPSVLHLFMFEDHV